MVSILYGDCDFRSLVDGANVRKLRLNGETRWLAQERAPTISVSMALSKYKVRKVLNLSCAKSIGILGNETLSLTPPHEFITLRISYIRKDNVYTNEYYNSHDSIAVETIKFESEFVEISEKQNSRNLRDRDFNAHDYEPRFFNSLYLYESFIDFRYLNKLKIAIIEILILVYNFW